METQTQAQQTEERQFTNDQVSKVIRLRAAEAYVASVRAAANSAHYEAGWSMADEDRKVQALMSQIQDLCHQANRAIQESIFKVVRS